MSCAMKKPAVFGVYGESNTGKTTLVIKLIKRLTSENFKVATVKITDKKIGADTEDTDTWKHGLAGSDLVVFSSPVETDYLLKQNKNIDEILQTINAFDKYDIILVEGANDKKTPKIRLGSIVERENTILSYTGDFDKLVERIKDETNKGCENVEEKICIKINGKQIPLSEFPSDIIKNTISGMLKSLKDVDEIKDVEIHFKL